MSVDVRSLDWWELEKLFTEKDYEAIRRARETPWEEIDPDWAETEAGRYELDSIRSNKMHYDEYQAGML